MGAMSLAGGGSYGKHEPSVALGRTWKALGNHSGCGILRQVSGHIGQGLGPLPNSMAFGRGAFLLIRVREAAMGAASGVMPSERPVRSFW